MTHLLVSSELAKGHVEVDPFASYLELPFSLVCYPVSLGTTLILPWSFVLEFFIDSFAHPLHTHLQ